MRIKGMKLTKPEGLVGSWPIRPAIIESGFAPYAQCSADVSKLGGVDGCTRRLCFVDDEQHELSRVDRVLSQEFDVGVGPDLDTAVGRVSGKPQLFLLDMYYGPDTGSSDRTRVAQAWRELAEAQRRFYDLLRSLGQSAEGGLELAAHVRRRFPGVPIVFFTRKGSLEDADKTFRAGAAAVLKKPDPAASGDTLGNADGALDDAMTAYRKELVRRLAYIIDQHTIVARHPRLAGSILGVAASLVASLIYSIAFQ